jgi:hypothetical protein
MDDPLTIILAAVLLLLPVVLGILAAATHLADQKRRQRPYDSVVRATWPDRSASIASSGLP